MTWWGWAPSQAATSVIPGGHHVDQLVVGHVADRGRPALVPIGPRAGEERLVEPDRVGRLQPLGVGSHQGLAVTDGGGVDEVPGAVEFVGHVADRPPGAHLLDHPLGGPGRQAATLRGDPVVREGEGGDRTGGVHAAEAVLLPANRHRHPAKGQVHVGDDGTVLHPGPLPTTLTPPVHDHLLNRDLAGRAASTIGQDPHVFQAHQVRDDRTRVGEHRGVEDLLFHTNKAEAPLCFRRGCSPGVAQRASDPAGS